MLRRPVTDIFFDLDHTLWDFERNSALTYERIFGTHGITVSLPEFLECYIPLNLHYWKLYREGKIEKQALRYQRLKTVFDRLGYPITDKMIHLLSEAYIDQLSTYTHLVPSALEVLQYLRPKYRLHIITNGFEEVQSRKLNNSGIAGYFEKVIDSERAGVKKPHPAIFKMALQLAGAMPNSSVMIGDSLEADILGARAVGLQTLHFNAHREPPHENGLIIEDLREIKRYL